MDHTHAFACGSAWTKKLSNISIVQDDGLFGYFPEFSDLVQKDDVADSVARLEAISPAEVAGMLARVPQELEVSREIAKAIQSLVVDRAKYVASSIANRIWKQRSLFGDSQ
mgnify:FL=1